MALEAVVFQQDPISYGFKDLHTLLGGTAPWSCGFGFEEAVANYATLPQNGVFSGLNANSDSSLSSMIHQSVTNSSSPDYCNFDGFFTGDFPNPVEASAANSSSCRRKRRRRTRTAKNKEEVENQRMTHITVERNRRKQMNDYLAVLRSLMPSSYIQRGDQASIVGGAINYVKELEQLLQYLEAQKRTQLQQQEEEASFCSPFSNFFTFPQYSTCSTLQKNSRDQSSMADENHYAAIADVEVTMVESHANLKILSKRQPKQLLKIVTGLHSLGLNVLHLNVTTAHQTILFSFSVKVEEDCQLTSVNEIAAAVYQMMGRIQLEAALS